jgi:putative MATE family efflux protein
VVVTDRVHAGPAAAAEQGAEPTDFAERNSAPTQLLALPPTRAILRLAAPTTVVMLVAATSNVLYTYYVSRLGADAIATVSLVFPVSLLAITAMAGGVGAGAASAVARALGAGQRHEATRIAEHAIVLAFAVGVSFAAAVFVGAPVLFRLMGGQGTVLLDAILFARVLFGGAMISFTAVMLDSIMRGEGNVRIPAIWSSSSLLLQIALTPLFMFVARLGLLGAPIAMLTSQALAGIPRAAWVFGGRGILQPAPWPRRLSFGPLGEILRVGIPASLSTTVNYAGMMVLTGILARFGEAHLAAFGLGTRLDFLLLSFVYGFGAAVLTLVGMATGARRPHLVTVYVRRAGVLMVLLMTIPAALLWWEPGLWLGLFTDDAGIRSVGADYFRIIGASYPFMGVSMVLAFAFQGLGRATAPLVLMVVRIGGVLAASLLCTQWLGLGDRAVFAVVALGNILSAFVMVLLFRAVPRGPAVNTGETRFAGSVADA